MKSARSKACDIKPEVRQKVFERENYCCALCGEFIRDYGGQAAHFISRKNGGLGIEENLIALCWKCHHRLDQTTERKNLLAFVKAYLDQKYPDFSDDKRVYKK